MKFNFNKPQNLEMHNYIDAVRKLRDCGVDAYLDIPKMVVVGAQSSGKSSLLEVLSNVAFPRGSGTCTRHPTELRLEHDDNCRKFMGSIHVRWGENRGPIDKDRWIKNSLNLLSEYNGSFENNEKIPVESFDSFKQILKDVTARFMGLTPDFFSDSVIVVHIRSSEVKDFEVIDTPGIVETGFKDEEIKWLKNMIKGYMEKENTIIVVANECSGDLSNQTVLDFVLSCDPSQQRTVFVLTKADMILEADEKRWIDMIKGIGQWSNYGKYHGVFAVRARTPKELLDEIDPEERKNAEIEWFEKDMWNDVDKNRLGTWSLEKKLKDVLLELFKKTLPELTDKAKKALNEVYKNLSTIKSTVPENKHEKMKLLLSILDNIDEKIKFLFAFSNDFDCDKSFYNGINKCFGILRKELKQISDIPKENFQELNIEFHCSVYDNGNWRPASCEIETIDPHTDYTVYLNDSEEIMNSIYISEPLSKTSKLSDRQKWQEYYFKTEKLVKDEQGRLLPDEISNNIRPRLILDKIKQWKAPVLRKQKEMCNIVFKEINALCLKEVENFPHFKPALKLIINKYFKTCENLLFSNLDMFVNMESRPFTLNIEYLKIKKKNNVPEKLILKKAEEIIGHEIDESKGVKSMYPNVVDYVNKTFFNSKTFQSNYNEICGLISSARSYLNVSVERFSDNISMLFDHVILKGFYNSFKYDIKTEILQTNIDELLQESDDILVKRNALIKKHDALNNAIDTLEFLF